MNQTISYVNTYCDQPHAHWYEHIYSSYYPNSPHNSKHMFDVYTLTHVFWPMLFMWIGKKLIPFYKNEIAIILIILSSFFELYENQPNQIIKYRRIEINSSGKTNYRGDSVINSIGDILGNIIGVYLGYVIEEDATFVFIMIMLFFIVTINVEFTYWTDFMQFGFNSI